MAYDRKAYREYLKSNPFKSLPPTDETNTADLGSPSVDDDDSETVKASRPAQASTTVLPTPGRVSTGEESKTSQVVGPL